VQIGPYRIVEELARGGAGVVFRAEDEAGEPVALKLLHSARLSRPLSRKRFLAEAQALSRLQHPHVIRYRGSGQQKGMPWLALEFVEGQSLQRRLDEGPLPVWKAIRIGQQLASALRYVHDCGVLHRDLKPDNVLLRGDEALLTDFGLALDDASEEERLTQTGAFLGTPGYWSPEQARGEKQRIGPATDVYGWGAVLYACLTGGPPVEADSLPALVASIGVRRIPPPHELRPEVPRWLSRLCLSCLAVDPQARPASMEAVARALIQGPQLAGHAGARRLRRALVAVALLAVLALGGVALVATRGGSSERAAALATEARDHLAAGRFAEALRTCDAALALDPTRGAVYSNRGSAKVELGRSEEALDDYARALERGASEFNVRANRARALSELGRYEEARADLDVALELRPDSVTARVSRASTLFYLGHAEEALADYARALELEPDRLGALTSRAEVFRQLGRLEEALVDLDRLVSLDPQRAKTQISRGEVLADLGRFPEALEAFGSAVERVPDDSNLRVKRMQVALQAKRFEVALADLDWLAAREPGDEAIPRIRARCLLGLKRWEEALLACADALRVEPDDAQVHAQRAMALFALERYAETIEAVDRALLAGLLGEEAEAMRGLRVRARERLGG